MLRKDKCFTPRPQRSREHRDNYYMAVKHRNAIEPWSKDPVLMNSLSMSFDFSAP